MKVERGGGCFAGEIVFFSSEAPPFLSLYHFVLASKRSLGKMLKKSWAILRFPPNSSFSFRKSRRRSRRSPYPIF